MSRTAGLLAIAAFGIVLTWAFDARLGAELARSGLSADLVNSVFAQRQKLAGIVIPDGLAMRPQAP